MDLGWFVCVCWPAAWELLRTGSTCPCQNMHRDIIPCNSLLGQKGVENSCWLESWMLSMAFHNAVTSFHGENPGTVSILHGEDKGDMDHSEPGSVKVSRSLPSVRTRSIGHCWGSWQSVEVRRASTLRILNERKFQFCFHLTHWDSKARFFLQLSWEMRCLKPLAAQKCPKSPHARWRGTFAHSCSLAIYFLNLRTIHSGGKTLCRCYLCCQDVWFCFCFNQSKTKNNFNSPSCHISHIDQVKFVYSTCPRERRGYGFFVLTARLLDWDGFGMIWVCVCCPAAWELLRAGSTCPCQNMHRDIIPCNSLLGQKGIEKSCWLENWMLSMAFHNAVWLISMVKIRQLFPSCMGTTKATIWQTEWAVMAVNYVQSHWSSWIVLSPNLRAVCKRLQQTLLGQLAMCVNDATTRLCDFERAEVSMRFARKFFCNCYLKWDQSA